jgi:hypothetical protein
MKMGKKSGMVWGGGARSSHATEHRYRGDQFKARILGGYETATRHSRPGSFGRGCLLGIHA